MVLITGGTLDTKHPYKSTPGEGVLKGQKSISGVWFHPCYMVFLLKQDQPCNESVDLSLVEQPTKHVLVINDPELKRSSCKPLRLGFDYGNRVRFWAACASAGAVCTMSTL